MKAVHVDLINCYGIKKLQRVFDFSQQSVYAIYAANGAMKTSFAETFKDVANAAPSRDRIFPARVSSRSITDEHNVDLPKDVVHVVSPYDEVYSHTEKTSTLLVDAKLRKEYEQLHLDIDKAKDTFLRALKEQSGSKKDIEREISSTFTKSDDSFYRALIRVKDEVFTQKDAPFSDIRYDTVFDDKVLQFLGTKDVKTVLESYVRRYNELLAASTYFKQGTFNYYNAATIAKSLADNGFFDAKHTVRLNADETLEISSQAQLEDLIAKEKEGISKDKELRKKFAEVEKLITKNSSVRDFQHYLTDHEALLPKLANIDSFKEEIWKSYFKARLELYKDLIDKFQAAQERERAIELEASKQRTQWEAVIDIFNDRFFVPFTLTARNRIPVMLGTEPMLSLGFNFEDGADNAPVEKATLMQVLSTGEKKALYVLNVIFEVEARKKANQDTLFIVDDIADSFDYKNKYAIIQYLQDIAAEPSFKLIILTHNFDFFRTVQSRFVPYSCCLMAFRTDAGLQLEKASGIKNVFVHDWKPQFFSDPRKRIASIPFVRNIVEYTKGDSDPAYVKLSSLLHWRSDSAAITQGELDQLYNEVFTPIGASTDATALVVDAIEHEADECLAAGDGFNFANKVVLSIAIRIAAERFMIGKINDAVFVGGIKGNQTQVLLTKYKALFSDQREALNALQRVVLMTPENIHLNSFMYEPILDMSDDHLKRLYSAVRALT
ncbi:MAG: phage infection protein [Erythrobacter sp.]|nr:phage infection protein [Erythrobacter sp.]